MKATTIVIGLAAVIAGVLIVKKVSAQEQQTSSYDCDMSDIMYCGSVMNDCQLRSDWC